MEESAVRILRRVTWLDAYISTADSSQQILVSDTGNDQTQLASARRVIKWMGREVMMTDASAGHNVGEVFPVVSVVANIRRWRMLTMSLYVHFFVSCYMYFVI